ncbi:hypothetical protein C2S53_012352 [Perilla frutescens var. hirtella]|uniref:non-specific serine/threonine protein kinase n=1 Tax=Perilla frutescens var. hirtella TaxID=608512 RepID=A0AAD4NYB8_PERFH|nr:hypothetical protein C2S53_012352 [Perilla frutescens var. hirtella]
MEKTCKLQHALAATLLLQYIIPASMAILSSQTDESSLLALKLSISQDPDNAIAKNWSSSTPVCSWTGVSCSKKHNNRVTSLNISNMNLEGTIPPQLGNLSFLTSLNVYNNRFHGDLPVELSKLRRLRYINLGSNNFTGPLPSFLSSWPNLQSLDFSNNEFSGSITTSFADVPKLVSLILSWNLLEGAIPQELCNLRLLQHLEIEGNRFTDQIPVCIFNITVLQQIRLRGNRLTGKLPEDLCDNLPNLDSLGLSDNELEGPLPPGLQKCSKLRVLLMIHNKFTGYIPREIGNLTWLTRLDIRGNNLRGHIPSEIGKLQKLEGFGADECGLSGSIPESLFNISALRMTTMVDNFLTGTLPTIIGKGSPNLDGLYLGMNNLSGFIPDSLSNASKLVVLDLSKNSFSGTIPDWIGSFRELEVLQLGVNQFTNPSAPHLTFLTSLTKCRNLRELVIGWSPLSGKLPTSIGNFSASLKILTLYRSRITGSIPSSIGNLSGLAELGLIDNELTGSIPTTIRGLDQLQELYLLDNNLTGSFPEEICSLENLGGLALSSNKLSGPLPACVGNMTSLRNLYLDSNRFTSTLPAGIWSLSNLLRFSASSNALTGHLPQQIASLKAVIFFDLSTNLFSGQIPTTIGSLESLLPFDLADNRFEGPIPESFGEMLSLEQLDIAYNNLSGEIPKSLERLIYLTYFNASFNDLSGEIPNGGPFKNFTSQSFMSNKALCGASRFEVPPCQVRSPESRMGKRKLVIALSTSLGVASTLVLLLVALFLLKRTRKWKYASQTQTLDIATHQRISYSDLQQATDGFSESNVLGVGGFSTVYKGILRDGSLAAVKVFNMQLEDGFKSFDTECEVLCSLRHRNLTKVISSCTSADFRALILDYMPSGSLEKWLYSHNNFLDLLQRLNIVIDVACALDYLHNGFIKPVVHCDLKPSNVLLDEELVGHVSDFGISKILAEDENIAQTKTLATVGYMAPEYGSEGIVSTRSDIYSYGIVLMETFTNRRPSDDMFAGELSLKKWVMDSLPSQITQVIDCNLLMQKEEDFDAKVQCLISVMELALKCTHELPEMRICMKDAAAAVNKIKLQFLASCGRC